MKVQVIYDVTMALMDEMIDNTSETTVSRVDLESTRDYQARTPGILTILQTEVIMRLKEAGEDVSDLDRLTKMTDEVDLENNICLGVLPYGLAARLLGQDDASLANYFSSLYADNLSNSIRTSENKYIAEQIDREDVYGSLLR